MEALLQDAPSRTDRVSRPAPQRRDALVHRNGGGEHRRDRQRRAHQRRDRRHHRRKEAEERQALLAREVDHRAKNALALVQSIVRLTKANSISEYGAIIEGRLKALSRAHALLSDSRWQGAEFAKLVDEELAPFRSTNVDRIRASGPKVLLNPTTAQTLALALHELATNAAKYGASVASLRQS